MTSTSANDPEGSILSFVVTPKLIHEEQSDGTIHNVTFEVKIFLGSKEIGNKDGFDDPKGGPSKWRRQIWKSKEAGSQAVFKNKTNTGFILDASESDLLELGKQFSEACCESFNKAKYPLSVTFRSGDLEGTVITRNYPDIPQPLWELGSNGVATSFLVTPRLISLNGSNEYLTFDVAISLNLSKFGFSIPESRRKKIDGEVNSVKKAGLQNVFGETLHGNTSCLKNPSDEKLHTCTEMFAEGCLKRLNELGMSALVKWDTGNGTGQLETKRYLELNEVPDSTESQ